MEVDPAQILSEQVMQKLGKLTPTLVYGVFNRMSIEHGRDPSPEFRRRFGINVQAVQAQRIDPLYQTKMEQVFDANYQYQAQQYAQRYQINQLKNLIHRKLKIVLGPEFKTQYKAILYDIAQATLQTTTFKSRTNSFCFFCV